LPIDNLSPGSHSSKPQTQNGDNGGEGVSGDDTTKGTEKEISGALAWKALLAKAYNHTREARLKTFDNDADYLSTHLKNLQITREEQTARREKQRQAKKFEEKVIFSLSLSLSLSLSISAVCVAYCIYLLYDMQRKTWNMLTPHFL
jgi:hypothetical protein